MHESDTFMAIIDEGREIQARYTIRRLGPRRLGEPDEPTLTLLEGITDIDRLNRMIDQLGQASSWLALLDVP